MIKERDGRERKTEKNCKQTGKRERERRERGRERAGGGARERRERGRERAGGRAREREREGGRERERERERADLPVGSCSYFCDGIPPSPTYVGFLYTSTFVLVIFGRERA